MLNIYAAWHKDMNIRRKSSSGGAFTALAEYILDQGGIVVGASYNNEFIVEHIVIEDKGLLHLLRGTKYVRSRIDKVLPAVRKILETGKLVLFTGTPCQINALYRYVGKEHDNLFTIDFFCSGVASPRIWKDYISLRANLDKSSIKNIDTSYKDIFGWSQEKFLIQFTSGRAYCCGKKQDSFFRLLLEKYSLCPECYSCPYMNKKRISDISCGDYRLYQKNYNEEDNKDTGVSLLTVNSAKGLHLFKSIQNDIINYPRDVEDNLLNDLIKVSTNADKSKYIRFWHDYNLLGLECTMSKIFAESNSQRREAYQSHFFQRWMSFKDAGYKIEDLLKGYGLSKIIIYGIGNVGTQLYNELKEADMVTAFIDKNAGKSNLDGVPVIGIEQAASYSEPIIITPSYLFQQIADELIDKNVMPSRIISFNMLLLWKTGNKQGLPSFNSKWYNGKFNNIFLITGAQFANKGAQSMLFVAVSEIRKRFEDAYIYYLPINVREDYPLDIMSRYSFNILRQRTEYGSNLYEILPLLTAIIDVSGYGLSSNWNSDWYINHISLARQYKVPMYLMPQSFGPFDFEQAMDTKIAELLKYPRVIFAREREGMDLLQSKYHLTNVRISNDLVLQHKGLDIDLIYREKVNPEYPKLLTEKNVGIVPNIRNFEFGNERLILKFYELIIELLLMLDKNVYIFAHSDDMAVCRKIYYNHKGNRKVCLIEKELDCIEYCMFIRQFDFLIASRFHAIVHAYKEGIPCIAIGWARKYHELLQLVNQEKYIFDVREELNAIKLKNVLVEINKNIEKEQKVIRKSLEKVYIENCFDCLTEE